MVDLSRLISTYPSCLENEAKLGGTLKDMYPQSENKRKIHALLCAYKCGVIDFLLHTKLSSDTVNRFCNLIVGKYIIEPAAARWALKTWANAYLADYSGKTIDETIFAASDNLTTEVSLTEKQKQAVLCKASRIAVIAGPGSGKTRVLTERICHLVEHEGVKESSVLALSFSSKAAKEMRVRLSERLGARAKKINVTTFHSFGLQVVRENADLLNLKPDFDIASSTEKAKIIRKLLDEEKLSDVSPYDCIQQIGFYRNGQVQTDPEVARLSEKYVAELRSNNLIDFDDMIVLTADLFCHNATVLNGYRDSLSHILIDEVQDLNIIQTDIVNALTSASTSLFIVGDDDQCIYEWRGAKPSFLQDFSHSVGTTVFRLEENFRSADGIVNFSGELIGYNTNRITKRMRAMRKAFKKSFTANMEKGSIVAKRFRSQAEESSFICNEIQRLTSNGDFCLDDFAILLRNKKQFEIIGKKLCENQIPYLEQVSEVSAYDDFIPVLKAIVDPKRKQGINRGIEYPMSVMDHFAYQEVLEKFNIDEDKPIYEVFEILNSNGQEFEDCEVFRQRFRLLMKLHENLDCKTASETIKELISQYESEPFAKMKKLKERLEHLHTLVSLAMDFESAESATTSKTSLEKFIDFLALTAQDESTKESNDAAVNIMTCHKSKGLEFPVVFIPGVQVGTFPNDFFLKTKSDVEAERRLFYVSMTRAINKLYLTCNDDPFVGKGVAEKGFLAEIPGIVIEGGST